MILGIKSRVFFTLDSIHVSMLWEDLEGAGGEGGGRGDWDGEEM